jgi:hypothetical protein
LTEVDRVLAEVRSQLDLVAGRTPNHEAEEVAS